MIRFLSRHVLATVSEYCRERLIELGWVEEPINFGSRPVLVMDYDPQAEAVQVQPNVLAISLGSQAVDVLEQLGGGLYSVEIPVFFDVYGESGALAVSIASDVRDQFSRDAVLRLRDFTAGSPGLETDILMEFYNVEGPERPQASLTASTDDFRNNWRTVRATALITYADGT